MRKLINVREIFKILMIYLITTIVSLVVAKFVVKYNYIRTEWNNYLWVVVIFTMLFLMLIRLFKVNFKVVLIFLGIIMFLLLFKLVNLGNFTGVGNTADEDIFPIMTLISIYTTIPFQFVIYTSVGYNIGKKLYIILPIYMLILTLLSYITLKLNVKNDNK